MTRVAKFRKSIKPGDTVELWNYRSNKPTPITITSSTDVAFSYKYYDDQEDEWRYDREMFKNDWLEESLELVELYNTPLWRALE